MNVLNKVVSSASSADGKLWFHSDRGDLYVWKDPAGKIRSFQLSFFNDDQIDRREWLLEWGAGGIKCGQVDSKETDSREHDLNTPVIEMRRENNRDLSAQALSFLRKEGGMLPEEIKRFIETALRHPESL